MNRKGNIYFVFFKSAKALLRKYKKSRQITRRLRSNDFFETFLKNVARIECAAHHKRLYNACVWSKKDTFCKEFPQNAKDSSGSFSEAVVRRFYLKEMFLRISQSSQEIPCTGVSS